MGLEWLKKNLRVCRKPAYEPVSHRHQWISISKRRIGADQVRKQPDCSIVGLEEGRLYVGNVKRNIRTMKVVKPDRRVLPLDLPGREGEGARAPTLLASGLVKLPAAVRSQIDAGSHKGVGDAFRQLLNRFPFWQSLVAAAPGLKPYSLRHGYAWRGHKAYEHAYLCVIWPT